MRKGVPLLFQSSRVFRVILSFLMIPMTQALLFSQVQASQNPANAQTQVDLGWQYLDRGLPFEAIQQFQAALRLNPNYYQAYQGMAEAYFALDEFDEALIQLEGAISLDPQNLALRNFRGRILLALGKIDEAAAIFSEILSRNSLNRDALLGQAELLLGTGNLNRAQQALLNTLSIHPRDRKALLSLAILEEEEGRQGQAELYIQRALDYYSEHVLVQSIAGQLYLERGDYTRAEQHLSLALDLEPRNLEALFLQASLYIKLGRYSEALRPLQLALSIDPESDFYWYTRGLVLHKLQRTEEAITSLRRALLANPENEIARIFLESLVLEGRGFEDPLRQELAHFRLAQAGQFELQNRFERSMVFLDRGISLAPTNEALRRARASLYLKSRQNARYLEELSFLIDELGVQDRGLRDQREVYEHLLRDSVSARWQLDQFVLQPEFQILGIYTIEGRSWHLEAVSSVAQQLADMLLGNSRYSLNPDPLIQGRYRAPEAVAGPDQAFSLARQANSDYYIVLSLVEEERRITLKADLFLSRTGRLVKSFSIGRTGNHRVMESLLRLVQEIDSSIPLKARIVQRRLNQAIINLGEEQGLEAGQELNILSPDDILLSPDGKSYQYDSARVLGIFRIQETDALISLGTLEARSFFDSISLGDSVLPLAEAGDSNTLLEDAELFPAIYTRIRGIR